jgi:hypothetical protein
MADPISAAVVTATITLDRLAVTDMPALTEAMLLAADPGYRPSPRVLRVLRDYGLVDGNGEMRDTTREAALKRAGKDGGSDG